MMLLEGRAHLGGLAISVAGIQRGDVRFGKLGSLGELGLQPVDDRLAVAVEHPEREPERPHVLAAQRFLVSEAVRLHGVERQLRDVEVDHLPAVEAIVLERALVISRLGEVARRELAFVDDQQPAVAHLLGVGLQRGRVHRDKDVGLVACGIDRAGAEVDLEGRDAERRTLRRADFGREIREGREIVAGERGRQSELTAGQLHAVAAVAGKADDDRFLRRTGGCFFSVSRWVAVATDKSFTDAKRNGVSSLSPRGLFRHRLCRTGCRTSLARA